MEWIYTISESEMNSNIYIFGSEKHHDIELKTDDQFSRWFVEPGIYKKTTSEIRPVGELHLGRVESDFAGHYFRNFWKMIYRAIYRFNIAWQWMTGAIFLIGASMYDGWQQRNMKKYTFGYSNPLAFHLITHGFFVLSGLGIALCFFPYAISPMFWIIGIISMSAMGWKMMESFQTGQ